MTKKYAVKDRKTGLYLVGNGGKGKCEFGPRRKARRFHSATFAAYVVRAISQVVEGQFEVEKIRI